MACGPVGESDGSLWQSSHDIGGTQYNPATGVSQASGATPGQGPPGTGNYPGNSPGGNPGNNPPPGGGGSNGFPPQGGTGATPFNPGNGGSVVGFGGSPPGAGGFTQTGSGGAPVVVGGPPPPPGNSGPCNFTFNATTVTAHGQYSPKNVGALWIEDGSGKFVKSLEVWGSQRLSNLTAWVNNSGNNKVDAVTSATHSNHGPHSDHWDCSDVNHASVPNGAYQGCVSFAEDDSFFGFGAAAHVACTPFNKGAPGTVTPPNQANFTNMSLTMQ
jgi:hypothetical protein